MKIDPNVSYDKHLDALYMGCKDSGFAILEKSPDITKDALTLAILVEIPDGWPLMSDVIETAERAASRCFAVAGKRPLKSKKEAT